MTVPSESGGSPPARPHWLQVVAVGRDPRKTAIRILVLVIFCFVFFRYVVLPAQVDGISMAPTYKNHAINLINQLAYVSHGPRRGDVVAVRAWAGKHVMLMKRIIGLPGETVSFNHGRVFINGTLLDEPYEKWPCDWTLPPIRLGLREYFIVGDNRTMRWQDHYFGKVDRSRIVGKMLL
ncbi:MAG TPA: signal peptidase I [Verrucomicrobiae bacterium]|jgi:signal peptidase I|nr:signal peptidase I [Verrucomicrobiae bacterium]